MAEDLGRSGFVATSKGTDFQAEVFEGHRFLCQSFAISLIQDPGISGADIQDVAEQP